MFLQLLIFSFSHRLQLAFFLAFLAPPLPGLLKLTGPHDQLAQERKRPNSAAGPLAGPGLLLPHLPLHPHRGQQGRDRLGGVHQPQLHPNSLYSLSHWLLRRLFYHSGALITDSLKRSNYPFADHILLGRRVQGGVFHSICNI